MTQDIGTRTDQQIDGANQKKLLNDKLEQLANRRERRSRFSRSYLISGIVLLLLSPLMYVRGIGGERRALLSLATGAYGLLFLLGSTVISPREIDEQIARVEDELELLAIRDTSREQRAQKLLKIHQSELKRYYDQTLRQTSVIFFVGLGCIFLGFAVIGWSLYLISNSEPSELRQKLVVGGLGAIGGILSNFVAVIYLQMFRQTIFSLAEFHNRLVSTHNLYFGNFLMSKINKDIDLYERGLCEIASAVSAQRLPKTASYHDKTGGPKSIGPNSKSQAKPKKGRTTLVTSGPETMAPE